MITDVDFISTHRRSPKAFTRNRKLPFGTVVSTILQLAKRSLQIECNLLGETLMIESPSKQAFSKARYNLSYTAFKALNDEVLKDTYKDNPAGLWKGYRIFGVDGSNIRLPESEENEEYFGRHNSGGLNRGKDPILARISEVVDLTTGMVVNVDIGPMCEGERAIAWPQIKSTISMFQGLNQSKLLFVFDRGYVSKDIISEFESLGADFIFRVPRNFSKVVDNLIEKGECDCLVEISPEIRPLRLLVRLLPSGQKCVLLTSLIDSLEVKDCELMSIYWLRWSGCEEGYKKQKVALELENFIGIGTEAVLQEFWATVLSVNLFQLHCLEEEGAWNIDNPPTERINRSVVFGSLRSSVFKTVMGEITANDFWEKFVRVARRSKVKIRPGRQHSRSGMKKEKHVYRRVC